VRRVRLKPPRHTRSGVNLFKNKKGYDAGRTLKLERRKPRGLEREWEDEVRRLALPKHTNHVIDRKKLLRAMNHNKNRSEDAGRHTLSGPYGSDQLTPFHNLLKLFWWKHGLNSFEKPYTIHLVCLYIIINTPETRSSSHFRTEVPKTPMG
jgi:hypothetical protein